MSALPPPAIAKPQLTVFGSIHRPPGASRDRQVERAPLLRPLARFGRAAGIVGLGLMAALAQGCAEDLGCTLEARPSARVVVVDGAGTVVTSALVTVRRDGGATPQVPYCVRATDGGCTSWTVDGWAATLAISATRADGSGAVEQSINVPNIGTVDCPSPVVQDVKLVLAD